MKLSVCILSLLFAANCFGQELVLNGSFETNNGLPTNLGQWDLVQNWNNANSSIGTPDYFHFDGSGSTQLPNTSIAQINPKTGKAIMGFAACASSTNYREYISSALNTPFEVGDNYKVSFNLANGNIENSGMAGLKCNRIGVLLSTNSPVQTATNVIHNYPQFEILEVVSHTGWQEYSFVIKATQPFENICIGVFKDDASVSKVNDGTGQSIVAYYFIDDVSALKTKEEPTVIIGSGTGNNEDLSDIYIPNSFTPNNDNVNDLFKPVGKILSQYQFAIFDKWGEELFRTNNPEEGWNGDYGDKLLGAGVYFWTVNYFDKNPMGESVPQSMRGTVNLLR